jgi:prepilin-type processing-associated H-X9-DG protein
LAIATLNYESARGYFPAGRLHPDKKHKGRQTAENSYTNYSNVNGSESDWQLGYTSVHVRILDFIENGPLAGRVVSLGSFSQEMRYSGGQIVNPDAYEVFQAVEGFFLCPSDSNSSSPPLTENNYRTNFGGSTPMAGALTTGMQLSWRDTIRGVLYDGSGNGAFNYGERGLVAGQFKDGLSKTAFWAERDKGSNSSPPVRRYDLVTNGASSGLKSPEEWAAALFASGAAIDAPSNSITTLGRWAPEPGTSREFSNGWPFGTYLSTHYNHVAPPNWSGWDIGVNVPDTPGEPAIVSARSSHTRVVNVAFGDGHTQSVSDDIDLAVWRALGSRDGGEQVAGSP